MQLKASTDYGLRAVLYLAVRGETCSSKEIAERMSIPRDYLIQLAQLLRNEGILEAHPGKNGGYCLAKDPSDITLLDIMRAIDAETPAASSTRERRARRAAAPLDDEVQRAYERAIKRHDAFFASTTIASLVMRGGGCAGEL